MKSLYSHLKNKLNPLRAKTSPFKRFKYKYQKRDIIT